MLTTGSRIRMKECSKCHCKWVESDRNHHDVCPVCGSDAIREARPRENSSSDLARIGVAIVPSLIAIFLLFAIVSTTPQADNGRALQYVLVTYCVFAIATPIFLLFWALKYFRYRFGPAPAGKAVSRALLCVLLAFGVTCINYFIAFAGCTLSVFMTST